MPYRLPKHVLRSRSEAMIWAVVLLAWLAACGDGAKTDVQLALDERAQAIADEDGDLESRLSLMDNLRRPVNQEIVEALLLVMKDRSQQAFIMTPDDSPLGYHTEESTFGGPDHRAELRWTAILALERLAEVQALPDLISALFDRHEVVRHFAARALFRLGSKKGIPVLLKGLEGKALANESANRVLKEITAKDFGFDTDAGWANKAKAIKLWTSYMEEVTPKAKLPRLGDDPDLDRRVRFLVAMLGKHQFLFMEQARRNLSMLGDLAVAHIESAWRDGFVNAKQRQLLHAYAVQVLAKIGSPAAEAAIVKLATTDGSPPVRSRAALALGEAHSEPSAQALLALLQDEDESVVIAAMRAAGARRLTSAVGKIKSTFMAQDQSKRGRLMAAFSLVRMGVAEKKHGALLDRIMTKGEAYEKAELADLLLEWKGELFGWDERRDPKEQEQAITKWRSVFYQ